ncbi:hypothetical protein PoB_000768200, partial [Plakobranchus ocellatus]
MGFKNNLYYNALCSLPHRGGTGTHYIHIRPLVASLSQVLRPRCKLQVTKSLRNNKVRSAETVCGFPFDLQCFALEDNDDEEEDEEENVDDDSLA